MKSILASMNFGPDTIVLDASDSMKDAFVNPGDTVVIQPQKYVKNGEMVAVEIKGGPVLLRRLYRVKDLILLKSENPKTPQIKENLSDIKVLGKVVLIMRQLKAVV